MKRTTALMILIFLAGAAFADTITLKSGHTVEGEVIEETDDSIKVDTGSGIPVTYYRDELQGDMKEARKENDALPAAFTMDELTPEQRQLLDEDYVTVGTLRVDLSDEEPEIQMRPPGPEELVDTADKLFRHGLIEEALAEVQKAIEQDKDYLPAYRVKADILQETGAPEESIPLYDLILEKDPDADEIYMNRGYAYGRLEQYDRAIEDYNKALALDPDAVNAISARASAYARTGEMPLAKKDYERLMDFSPEQANFGLGNIAAFDSNWEEALEYYDKTIAASSDFAPAYLMKGQILLELGQKAEGVEYIRKAEALGMPIPDELLQDIQ